MNCSKCEGMGWMSMLDGWERVQCMRCLGTGEERGACNDMLHMGDSMATCSFPKDHERFMNHKQHFMKLVLEQEGKRMVVEIVWSREEDEKS